MELVSASVVVEEVPSETSSLDQSQMAEEGAQPTTGPAQPLLPWSSLPPVPSGNEDPSAPRRPVAPPGPAAGPQTPPWAVEGQFVWEGAAAGTAHSRRFWGVRSRGGSGSRANHRRGWTRWPLLLWLERSGLQQQLCLLLRAAATYKALLVPVEFRDRSTSGQTTEAARSAD